MNGLLNVRVPDGALDLAYGCRMKYSYGVACADYDATVDELKNGNYRVVSEHTIGDNTYTTLACDEGMVHLYYTAHDGSVRLITDTLEKSILPPYETGSFEKVTDPSLCVIAMDYSHREVTDGNGMSYVIILPDGRFVIFDGGYAQDASRLYRFLCDNNKRSDGKLVIAAWVITHDHGDHTGCFYEFVKAGYSSKVTLQNWIVNPAVPEQFHRKAGWGNYLLNQVWDDLATFDGEVKWVRPHAGQKLRFCDVEFEVLFTHEDVYPINPSSLNDTSTVLRMIVDGQTVLFSGDCMRRSCDLMCDKLGDALKIDWLQINHHGHSGGTTEFYQKVAPTYTMWCTSNKAFAFRTCGIKYQWLGDALESNKYIYDTVGEENCFVADGMTKIVRMPLKNKEADITYYDMKA